MKTKKRELPPLTKHQQLLPGQQEIWIAPRRLLEKFIGLQRVGLEIVFYPNHERLSAKGKDYGRIDLQASGGEVLLAFLGTFADCKAFVRLFGFEPYREDALAFHYPRP